ncbi:M14 family metallopeptidase [Lutibacter sp. TH_r2]|uniref:M14 family metallopeptidase n=1 Tax=Lutibacter sp. TH_r2 TaxID=3082083 RepID=UPI002953BDF6|nr:M14 family metallopeptidase [Lutibacter sp. TH_r2]MDV7187362.1 M14 family metallopeptidase [Lutibacter sp. TH_r2]
MKKLFFSTLFLLICFSIHSQIKNPSEYLGYELGSRFTRHYNVTNYFKYLAKNSLQVEYKKYGETNEFRSLDLVFISSEENIKNLEEIRTDNLKRIGILKGSSEKEIAITWLSYNVHGNEASATEAAMKTAYELLTANNNYLKNTVVIIDPCVNPDGRDRYVNWYNQTKNTPYNSNPYVAEHNEPWPSGRPNHYLFDLNRDWAWATQIETQQRLKIYNTWMPHVHVDFHEQGYNNPYYFPPAAEPYHEIVTDWQIEFQQLIGKNHASYFDKNGWSYFTKQHFDLLYPSYGDTYPMYMGAIGMTYEQAGHGKAGLGVITKTGDELKLIDRIEHHTTTGLSTVEVASKNVDKLISEFELYFNNQNLKHKSYVLRGDSLKMNLLFELLNKHQINYFPANNETIKAFDYIKNKNSTVTTTTSDFVIPTNQPKGKMVKVLFEKQTKLTDSLTYDITAWSLPYAYGLNCFASEKEYLLKLNYETLPTKLKKNEPNYSCVAYLKNWTTINDSNFLGNLLENNILVKFATKEFNIEGNSYKKGTLLIQRGDNKSIKNFDEIITHLADKSRVQLTNVSTGFVDYGSDFGSSDYKLIPYKNIAVLAGEGTSSLNFGEIWHFFENDLKYPLNIINTRNFNRLSLSNYNVLILPSNFSANDNQFKKLKEFARNGGTLISIGNSINNFIDKKGFSIKRKNIESKNNDIIKPYSEYYRNQIENSITGSIFNSIIDTTHPLAFGYENTYYSLKLNATSYKLLEKGNNIGYFSKNTTNIAGFAGYKALKNIPNSLLFGSEYIGKGKVIYMVDNPLFRGFWENGKLFFANAVFLN